MIDGLFNHDMLEKVLKCLQQNSEWKTQQHTYSALYVDDKKWQKTNKDERFVQRDLWSRNNVSKNILNSDLAESFLRYLRSHEFMALVSRLFNVAITDINVGEPDINTNYFRIGPNDFVEQHV